MARADVNDLMAFLAVARERSFTRAAAKLGVSQSALSHTMRRLEARMGIRLLTRSTRSVSPTEAGERLLVSVGPRFDEIEAEIDALSELRDKPAGTIRITAGEHAVNTILWPRLEPFLSRFPDIKVEIYIENRLADIVAERHDAGVRLGEHVAKDMIAVRIGPDWRLVVVGSPSYLAGRSLPDTPHDLTSHRCINLGSRPMAGSTPGSSKMRARRSTSVSMANSSSTARCRFSRQPCRARPGLRSRGYGLAAHRAGRTRPRP